MKNEADSLLPANGKLTQLFSLLPVRVAEVVIVMLLVSFALNIVCIVPSTPFLHLDVDAPIDQLIQPGNYGLSATLALLKKNNLWGTYVLIIVFSVCLPPIKILIMGFLLFKPMKASTLRRALSWLCQLGRWGLIDVYFAMLLMMILWHQGVDVHLGGFAILSSNLGTEPGYGLYLFIVAILLSTCAAMILLHYTQSAEPPRMPCVVERTALVHHAGASGVGAVVLAVVALVLQLCTIALPSFSVVGIVREDVYVPLRPSEVRLDSSIYKTAPVFAGFMTIFLVLMPLATHLYCACIMLIPVQPAEWYESVFHRLVEFSMLDVFTLSYLVYLAQQDHIITLQLEAGSYCLFIYIPTMIASCLLFMHALRNALLQLMSSDVQSKPSRVEEP